MIFAQMVGCLNGSLLSIFICLSLKLVHFTHIYSYLHYWLIKGFVSLLVANIYLQLMQCLQHALMLKDNLHTAQARCVVGAYEPLLVLRARLAQVSAASILSMAARVLGQHPGDNSHPEPKSMSFSFKTLPVHDPLILLPLMS